MLHDTAEQLSTVAASKYSYTQLDDYTDLIGRTLLGVPPDFSGRSRGCSSEQIYLDYSQERLAAYGLQPSNLRAF